MVEYSIISWLLIVGLVLFSTVKMIPGDRRGDPRKNVIEMFLDSFQAYYDSYYYMLTLPLP